MSTAYALFNAQERGRLFISPGVGVYEGMIVGQCVREGDLPRNVAKKKHLINHRSAGADERVQVDAPITMSLDDAIKYIADDELVEIIPRSIRLRQRILNTEERRKQRKVRTQP